MRIDINIGVAAMKPESYTMKDMVFQHGRRLLHVMLLSSLVVIGSLVAQWQPTSGPEGAEVNAIHFSPSYMLIATSGGGLYRSTDGGNIWAQMSAGLPALPFYGYSFAKEGTDSILAALSDGVYRSTDGGVSWQYLSSQLGTKILVRGANIFLSSSGSGIYKSTDKGLTWTANNTGLANLLVRWMAENGSTIFAVTASGIDGGIYRSSDDGESWVLADSGVNHTQFHAVVANDSVIVAGGPVVYRSLDGGNSWAQISSTYTFALDMEDSTLYLGDNSGIRISYDYGATWPRSSPYFSGGGAIASRSDTVLVGSPVGFFFSSDRGVSWSIRSGGLNNGSASSLLSSGDTLYAGTKGMGPYISTDGGSSWTRIAPAFQANREINSFALSQGALIAGTVGSNVMRSTDGGANWNQSSTGSGYSGVSALLSVGSTVFAADPGGIYASTDGGASWNLKSADAFARGVADILAYGDTILVCSSQGVYRSADGGTTWSGGNTGIEGWNLRALTVLGNTIFVGSWSPQGVAYSTDGGFSWTVSSSAFSVYAMATYGQAVFAAGVNKAHMSLDQGGSWQDISDGILAGNTTSGSSLGLTIYGNQLMLATKRAGVMSRSLDPLIPPSAPQGLVAQVDPAQIRLTWRKNPESDITSYRIYADTSTNPSTQVGTASGGATDTSFGVSGLAGGVVYYFRVTAIDASGNESAVSNEVSATLPVFSEITTGFPNVQEGAFAWGDYDNDGDLDVLLTGDTGSGFMTALYRNDGNHVFVDVGASLPAVVSGAVTWGDYDNDGDIDILLTGADTPTTAISKILRNDGSDTFTDINASLVGVYLSSVGWGDFDNDGDLDVLITGWTGPGGSENSKIYRNDGNDSFVDVNAALYGVSDGAASWGDFDNDGDLDIAITGSKASGAISTIFRNDGGGTFTDINPSFPSMWNSDVVWGDYDDDGDLDLLLTGWTGSVRISRIYRNDGSETFSDISAPITPVRFSSGQWGDFDNDGDNDLLLAGDPGTGFITRIYENQGNDTFWAVDSSLTGVYNSDVGWVDTDNDNDLDVFVTGNPGSSRITALYLNNSFVSNTAPTAPSNLVPTISADTLSLQWDAGSDAETSAEGLTYNVRLGTSSGGNEIIAPASNVSTGYNKIVEGGNTGSGGYRVTVPEGVYYWSVQTIDNAYAGSPFSTEQSFTVNRTRHVAISGNDANDGSATSPLLTIQAALDAAVEGDTIKVAAGTYAENLTTSVAVVLRGGYDSSFTESQRDIFAHRSTVEAINTTMVIDQFGSAIDGFVFDGKSTIADVGLNLSGTSTISHNILVHIKTTFAHAIEATAPVILVNNTFYDTYYAVWLNSSGAIGSNIRNNIFSNNVYAFFNGAADGLTSYNLFYDNSSGNYAVGAPYTAPGPGELTANPLHRNPAAVDFRLYEGSPALDAGAPSDAVGDEPAPGNTRIDIGAYGGTVLSPYLPPVPPAPTLASPSSGATRVPATVRLVWNRTPETTSYHLQIASDPGFTSIVFDTTTADSSKTVFLVELSTTYYWRVAGNVALGTGLYSSWSFTTTSGAVHVSTSGDDGNDGSVSAPFRTIQTALIAMAPGDTVKVAEGTYAEGLVTQKPGYFRGSYTSSFLEADRHLYLHTSVLQAVSSSIIYDDQGIHISGFMFQDPSNLADDLLDLRKPVTVTQNIFRNSKKTFAHGIEASAAITIINNTFYNCYYAMYLNGSAAASVVKNNIFSTNNYAWYNLAADGITSYNILYNSPRAGTYTAPGIGETSLDPQFNEPTSGNFMLSFTSPAMNTGDPSASYNDPDGTRNDMGAFPVDWPPAPAAGLAAVSGLHVAHLTWHANTEPDVVGYYIYGGTSPSPTTKIDSTLGGRTDTAFTVSGLAGWTEYYFSVQAFDLVGNVSGLSNEVSIIPAVTGLEADSIALAAFYNSTNGPNWTNKTNWLTGALDTWSGITVTNGRVISVDLRNNNLSGTIPSEIADLDTLRALYLQENQLTGGIPAGLWNITTLISLHLNHNSLTGTLPAALGNLANLGSLYLESNQLSGPIPPEIGNLTQLSNLTLDRNSFSGDLPIELFSLTNLFHVTLFMNQFTGQIPPEIGNLVNLNYLALNNNQFSGPIPKEIGRLTGVWLIYLNDNLLTGDVPDSLRNLSNLAHLRLANNGLTGLPDLSNLLNLESLEVGGNGFTFAELEPNVGVASTTFTYDPQDSVGTATDTTIIGGGSFSMVAPYGGPATQYQWMKDGTDVSGAVASTYTITDPVPAESGAYICRYTSTTVTGMTLYGRPLNLTVVLSDLQKDSLALVALYNSTNGPNWTNKTNWLTGLVSTWYGVTIADGRVTHVILRSNNLVGTIPAALGSLDTLRQLFLDGNQLSGTIPQELGLIPTLQTLHLGSNELSGAIPSSLSSLTQMSHLNLGSNQLSGTIPSGLWSLGQLQFLVLGSNSLTGPLAPEIGNLVNLVDLELSVNPLTGTLPSTIGNLVQLQSLFLESCQLSGTVPMEIGRLQNLKHMRLTQNQLTGAIPDSVRRLTMLEGLYLGSNRFGLLPDLTSLASLITLDVSGNRLTFEDLEPNVGVASTTYTYSPQDSIGTATDTTILSGEAFSHSVSYAGGAATQYQWMKDGIDISAAVQSALSLPDPQPADSGSYVCRLTSSTVTDLTIYSRPVTLSVALSASDRDSLALVALYNSTNGANWTNNTNWLTGPVSSWAGVFLTDGRVTALILSHNNLVGTLPPEIGNLDSLGNFMAASNQLSGDIPVELWSLSRLWRIELENNMLTGSLPSAIGNVAGLVELSLSGNQLSGELPAELFTLTHLRMLDLAANDFSGILSDQIGNLTSLEDLQLNLNQFSGTIPSTIGNLLNLREALLNGNTFTGVLPNEIWSLNQLRTLSLHSNQLSGTIPASIGNMHSLDILYLQDNHLTGAVPVEVGSLDSLRIFDISGNHFTELPDLSGLSFLTNLAVGSNALTFDDLEPNVGAASTTFTYSPQDSIGTAADTIINVGQQLVLYAADTAPSDQYQWYKNGSSIAGATGNTYTISSAVAASAGLYTCTISNTALPSLTLRQRPVHVIVNVPASEVFPYADDFEGPGLDPFWTLSTVSGTVELSTDYAHSGSQSVKVSQTATGHAVFERAYSQPIRGRSSVWFYENGAGVQSLYVHFSMADHTQSPLQNFEIETEDWDGGPYYVIVDQTKTNTGITRTNGWHFLETEVDNDSAKLWIDGTLVGEGAGDFNFTKITLGISGPVYQAIPYYFDDFSFEPAEPRAPENLVAEPGDGTITLKWSQSSSTSVFRYNVYGGENREETMRVDSALGGRGDTTLTITGLANGTIYYYRVTSVDTDGNEGGYSNEVSATPSVPAYLPLMGEYVPDANTVLLLHLNQGGYALLPDYSSYMNKATVVGTPGVANGRFGNGRLFQGSGEYLSIPDDASLNFGTEEFTLETWISPTTYPPSTVGIIQKNVPPGYHLMMQSDGSLVAVLQDNVNGLNAVSNGPIPQGTWTHVAVIRDASTFKMYVNGHLTDERSAATLTGSTSNSSSLAIGSEPDNPGFIGVLDEIRFSNLSRSPQEFNLQLPPVDLNATPISSSRVDLKWQNGGGAVPLAKYYVYRGADSTSVTLIDSTDALLYTNDGLQENTQYFYRISAVDSTGFEGAKSYAVGATIITPQEISFARMGAEWATMFGGSSSDNVNQISVDRYGNAYLTGTYFSSSLTLGSTVLTNQGPPDLYDMTTDESGNVKWAHGYGTANGDHGNCLVTDEAGNVYGAGDYTNASLSIGSTTLQNNGSNDAYLVKYDALGNTIWVRGFGGNGSDVIRTVAIDPVGDIYVAGNFMSTTLTIGSTLLTNNGLYDFFLAKYDPNGNVIWAKSYGGSGGVNGEYISSMVLDHNGNVLVTGGFDSPSFVIGSSSVTNNGNTDVFHAKFDPAGSIIWLKSFGSSDNESAESGTVDADGNSYLTGTYFGSSIPIGTTTLTGQGAGGAFVMKYDVNGNTMWAKEFSGSTGSERGMSIVADGFGDILVGGEVGSGLSMIDTIPVILHGSQDVCLIKYTSEGGVRWAKIFGGESGDQIRSLTVDQFGNAYIAGTSSSTSFPIGNDTLQTHGGSDIFAAQIRFEELQAPVLSAASGSDSVFLAWTPIADPYLVGYRIFSGTSPGPTQESHSTVGDPADTSWTGTGLTEGTTYYFRVLSVDSAGNESAFSNEISITPSGSVPNAPSALTAIAMSSSQIDVSWSDNSNDEDGFRIERKTGAGGAYAEIATIGAEVTSYQNAGLDASTEYFYRVRAYHTAGTSAYSNEASATTHAPPQSVPNAPSTLTAQAVSSSQINITWSDNSGNEDGFRIERKTGSGGTYAEIVTLGANVSSYNNTGLLATTEYFYRVRAYNSVGSSSFSNEANATTLNTLTVPAAPANLTAQTISANQIDLNWTDNAGNEDNVVLERKTGAGGAYADVVTLDANTTSYSNTGLLANTLYYYRVHAINGAGSSGFSNEANAMTAALDVTAPGSPLSIQISPPDWTPEWQFTITWSHPTDQSGISAAWYSKFSPPTVGSPGTRVSVTAASILVPVDYGETGIYLYLEDGSGNKDPNSAVMVTAYCDPHAPSIEHDSLAVASFDSDNPQSISINATAADGLSQMASLGLMYRRSGTAWSAGNTISFPSTAGGTVAIPGSYINDNRLYGVDYRIRAEDNAGNIRYTPVHSIDITIATPITRTDPSGNPVSQPSLNTLPSGTPDVYAYRLFSVPFDLNDKRPREIFENQTGLGEYNMEEWRFFSYNSTLPLSNPFDEYPAIANTSIVEAGRAFFLILREGIVVKVGPGTVVKAEDLQKNGIHLQSGYNFIGNPLNVDISVDSLRLANGQSLMGKTWEFVGIGGTNSGWSPNPTTLKAWEGIVIDMGGSGPTTLQFNIADMSSAAAPDGGIARVKEDEAVKGTSWKLHLTATRTDNGVFDAENIAGISPNAIDTYGREDLTEPPFMGGGMISVAFHNDTDVLTHDVRSSGQEGYVWDFVLRTGEQRIPVDLVVEGSEATSGRVVVFDLDTRMAFDVTQRSDVRVNSGDGEKTFRLVVGDKDYIEANSDGIDAIPKEVVLHQNYPNPFNPETVIRFTLPKDGHIRMSVYDILGREIRTLIDRTVMAGYHEEYFDASHLAAGMYIVRLETGETVAARKMVLLK